MKFPVTVKHRTGKVKIYAPAGNFPYYRISFTAAGKRQMQTFATYSAAKAAGEKKAKELHQDSATASLTAGQARDAKAALERWDAYFQTTGKPSGDTAATQYGGKLHRSPFICAMARSQAVMASMCRVERTNKS